MAADESRSAGSRQLRSEWPAVPGGEWRETCATLHMWMQIAGKICLALTTRTNHFWNVAFHITPRGIATPVMPYTGGAFTITFDLVAHQLLVQLSDGHTSTLALEPQSVADFYARLQELLHAMGIDVRIWTMPTEVADPIRFERDTVHHAYDPRAAHALWLMMLAIEPVLERFRSGFIGKCSPIHFFWGGFDLAVTRFSGRRAPERPGADSITRESYSHEVISHGFWPGSGSVKEPSFYAYAAPEPEGFKTAAVEPSAAYYSTEFGEFLLPYEAVRASRSPDADLMAFMTSTYDAAATLARWNRAELERASVGRP
jgi:hypothetical protein